MLAGKTPHETRLYFAGEFEAVIRKWDVHGEAVATDAAEAVAKDKPLAEGEQPKKMTDEQFQQATRDIAFRCRQFYRDLRKRGADELAAAARVIRGVEEGCQSLRLAE